MHKIEGILLGLFIGIIVLMFLILDSVEALFLTFIIAIFILPITTIIIFRKISSEFKTALLIVSINCFFFLYLLIGNLLDPPAEMPGLGVVIIPVLWIGSSVVLFFVGLIIGKFLKNK